MKQQLLTQSVVHAYETAVQVLKEDSKPTTSESRMWLYASGEYSKHYYIRNTYLIPKTHVIDYLLSTHYEKYRRRLKANI